MTDSFLEKICKLEKEYKNGPLRKRSVPYTISKSVVGYQSSEDSENLMSVKSSVNHMMPFQLSLKLETQSELEDKLRYAIEKYESHNISILYSDKWINLIGVLEKEEDLKEQFKDLVAQMMLRGYNI